MLNMGKQLIRVAMPHVAIPEEWQTLREALLVKEKEATRLLDRIAAERRRLPMVRIDKSYTFEGGEGQQSLAELFDGRRQLIIYHFMFAPDWEVPCPGCSRRIDDVGHLAHLHARDTTFVAVALAPLNHLTALCDRKKWTVPFYSSGGSTFNTDMGVSVDGDEEFGLSVFFRDHADIVYRSYFTSGRGVEPASFRALLDLTPYGRQEEWEVSPKGWSQSPTHGWGSERDE
jgi:predicted dithiol-disulfide oxidoreductase (DUF899 family)